MARTLYHYLMGKFVLKMHRKLFALRGVGPYGPEATKITKIRERELTPTTGQIRKSERFDVYLAAVIFRLQAFISFSTNSSGMARTARSTGPFISPIFLNAGIPNTVPA